jgi:hypothetical protein
MTAERANDISRECRDPVDRKLRNLILVGNVIAWLAITYTLMRTFLF